MSDPRTGDDGELRRLLVQHFSDNDLRSLCQDLAVDYDALPGEGREAKARELIAFVQKRGRLADLLTAAARERPHVAWGAASLGPVSDRARPASLGPVSDRASAPRLGPAPETTGRAISDRASSPRLGPVSDRAHPDVEIHTVAQIGNPVIRAWRGVSARISRVLQIGGGRIEVGGDAESSKETPRP